MPFNSVRACPEEGRKSSSFPCFLWGPRAKPEKIKPRAFPRLDQPRKIPGTLIYYKERFYTAP